MAFTDDVKNGMNEAGKTLSSWGSVAAQTSSAIYKEARERIHTYNEIQKKKARISETERKLQSAYTSLGKLCYKEQAGESADRDVYQEHYDTIRQLEEQKRVLEEELHDLDGARVCANCGHVASEEDIFCPKCGDRLA